MNAAREKGELSGVLEGQGQCLQYRETGEVGVYSRTGKAALEGERGGGAAVEASRQNRMGKRESGGGGGSVAGRKQTITG